MGEAHVGCSGWNYRDWRGPVYPPGVPTRRWLEIYAERFDTVEVNATFYRLARREAVERWTQQVPAEFRFAVKASRYLTHMKRLREIEAGIERFFTPLEPLRATGQLGPVLWQLPERFTRDEARLAGLMERLPAGRHAVEFRHESWFTEPVLALLQAFDVALVVADDSRRPPLPDPPSPTTWRYVRFHYGRGGDGDYAPDELDAWADRLATWRRDGDVYAYFNNDWNAYAPRNADAVAARLRISAGAHRRAGREGPPSMTGTG
jgi:uncharacterized protein YecE (DUF72 family)